MKYFLFPLLVLPVLALTLLPVASPAPAAAPTKTSAVTDLSVAEAPLAVLELFTSQGCSSCPPADALLQELDARASAGEPIIALSYHVDYWNYLGWKDPFSSAYYSARQTDYTERIGARTYTPQLVVNGREEMIGSRRNDVKAAVARALDNPQASHQPVLTTHLRDGKIIVAYSLKGAELSAYRVTALVTQNSAVSAVKRGENRGRELRHHNIVRVMEHTKAAAAGMFELTVPEGLMTDDIQVVLLVQHTRTHAIVGATRSVVSAR